MVLAEAKLDQHRAETGKTLAEHEKHIRVVFETIRQLMVEEDPTPTPRVGFKLPEMWLTLCEFLQLGVFFQRGLRWDVGGFADHFSPDVCSLEIILKLIRNEGVLFTQRRFESGFTLSCPNQHGFNIISRVSLVIWVRHVIKRCR